MNDAAKAIARYADGQRSSKQIAELTGYSPRYVRRLMTRHGMPALNRGAQPGARNPEYRGGRSIDLDGYVTVPAAGHPYVRRVGRILEHRLVMEQTLGRALKPEEVVDHIDGLTLHNAPDNLRVFASNGEHLRVTISGKPRQWSPLGRANIGVRTDRGATCQPVDTYHLRKKRGDVRLRQILLAALSLGIDSPYLSGTRRHLAKAGIVDWSRPSLERELADVYARWELDHVL